MRGLYLIVIGMMAMTIDVAHAQEGSAPPPPSALPGSAAEMMRGPDDFATELDRLRSEKARPGYTQSLQPIPVMAADVTPGSPVRDARGVVMGTIERVGEGFAIVTTPVGRIEVEFTSIAKNSRGLLINMLRSKFYKLVEGSSGR